jgi:fimbrial chaperone protein
MNTRMRQFFFSCLVCLLLPLSSFAGEWRVTPISLDLGKDAKSGVITVSNDAAERLNVQMKAMEWTQDAEGKDVYSETADIIFFPKIMTIEKKEERIIRVGIKIPALTREKTYRLYVEEIPETKKKSEATAVAIAIRFGVPIFVKPLKDEEKGEISALSLSKGVLTAVVKNTGTSHFRITTVSIKGKNGKGEQSFATELPGWYLLSGSTRSHSTSVAREACRNTARIEAEVRTTTISFSGKFDVDKAMCSP